MTDKLPGVSSPRQRIQITEDDLAPEPGSTSPARPSVPPAPAPGMLYRQGLRGLPCQPRVRCTGKTPGASRAGSGSRGEYTRRRGHEGFADAYRRIVCAGQRFVLQWLRQRDSSPGGRMSPLWGSHRQRRAGDRRRDERSAELEVRRSRDSPIACAYRGGAFVRGPGRTRDRVLRRGLHLGLADLCPRRLVHPADRVGLGSNRCQQMRSDAQPAAASPSRNPGSPGCTHALS